MSADKLKGLKVILLAAGSRWCVEEKGEARYITFIGKGGRKNKNKSNSGLLKLADGYTIKI
jgi:hypothetical protein